MTCFKPFYPFLLVFLILFSSQGYASTVDFTDNHNFWPTWPGHSSYGYNDDNIDVVGNPDISGGKAIIGNDGYLKSIVFNYTVQNNDWDRLIPGNLFINLLTSPTDHYWDYVVNTMGADYSSSLAAGNYGLYTVTSLNIDDRKGFNDSKYVLSGQDNTGVWSGYVIRDNHPIGIQPRYLTNNNKLGVVSYSGWPNKEINNPDVGHAIYDFTTYNNGQGLDLGGTDFFIIGWETTCANDVVYEMVDPPHATPEPGSILLVGIGLLGAGFMKKRFKK